MRWLLIWGLLLGGCALNPDSSPTPARLTETPVVVPQQPPSEWTLIFYFAADNDLEQAEMDDLEELTKLPEDPHVHILALVDRSPLGEPSEGYSNRAVANLANWSHAKLLDVRPDKLTQLDDWGQLNMADPQTLRRLLQVAQERYPASHYGLFLVDHGQAWAGVCGDESASRAGDTMDLKELQAALKTLKRPLDLLALDACMMSTLEVYLATAPYTRYTVASQDSLPGQGLDYLGALTHLQQQPESDGLQLGKWFLEAYRHSLKSDPQELSRLQLALLSSQPQRALAHAWQELAEKLRPEVAQHWLTLAKARASSQSFHLEEGGHDAEVHDLGQLLQQLAQRLPALSASATEVRKQLKEVVVDQVRGRFRQRCSGLSVFFPPLAEQLSSEYFAAVEPLTGEWVKFLKEYTQMERRVQPRPPLSAVTILSGGAHQMQFQARLGNPEGVARSYTILVKDHRIVGQMTCVAADDSTLLRDYFDYTWLCLQEEGAGVSLLAHLQSVEFEAPSSSTALATVVCQLKRKEGRTSVPVQLYFSLQPDDQHRPSPLLGVSRSSGLGVVEVQLREGDQLSFLQPDLRPGGHGDRGPALTVVHPQQLQLRLAPVPPGNYELGFLVQDVQGRSHWQTKPLLWGE